MARKAFAPPEATLRALVKWLQSEQVPWLLIGGVAASLLGHPRFTRDVDVLVLLGEDRWEKFLNAAAKFGFVPRIENPLAFARRSRVFLLSHKPSEVDVDISLAGLLLEEQSIARVRWTKVGGLSLPLPIPEDLIIMKAVAHRPQDIADIEALLAAKPKLNLRRIRKWLKEFSAALDMPEILNDFEDSLRRTRARKR